MKISILSILLFAVVVMAAELPLVQVEGKNFTVNGEPTVFEGLATSDPDKLDKDGHWDQNHFEQAAAWGAKVIRFAVHPRAWRERGEANYLLLLDDGIRWADENDMYVIIDWHSIGNLWNQKFQHEMYETTLQETYDFWRIIARRYSGNTTVAFYELFNEPTISGERFGTCTWEQWQELVGQIIAVVRAWDKDTVVLVTGFNWGYDLKPVRWQPFTQRNLGYTVHPYPQKRPEPWVNDWEDDWGFVADSYPLFATELGFMSEDDKGAHVPTIGDETYGRTLVDYFEEKNISWMPWCFDPDWYPTLISDWDYTPTRQGKFFKKKIKD